jgi:D-mannonate dehydratase
MLYLQDADPAYTGHPTGSTRLYVRTFPLEVQELLQVLSQISQERYDYNGKIALWTERLRNVASSTIVYIRYAGMSDYEPWKRHLEDLTPVDTGTFALSFIQKTLLTFPHVIKNATIQEVRAARIEFSVDQSILNIREQALIGLLDSGSLNTEAGGAYQHDATSVDETVFATLTTRVSAQLPIATKACGANKLQQILDLASDIQQYANENPL